MTMYGEIESALIKQLPKLKAQAFNLTKNVEDADDLVSELCLNVLSKKEYFKDNKNINGWFSVILKNIFINNYRKNQRKADIMVDFDPSQFKNKLFSTEETDSNIIYQELINQIDKDSVDYKLFIGFVNGYQYLQLAEIFELPEGTVKSKIHFFRKNLRNKILGIKDQKRKRKST